MRRFLLFFATTAAVYAAAPSFEKSVRPVVAKYCAGCHNSNTKTGGVDLTAYPDSASAVAAPEVWENVAKRLAAGTMPPKGLPRPTDTAVASIRSWVSTAVRAAEAKRPLDPGRVTARRLNKFEYNRTVEDLLAIHFNPADDFPADDSGYGFDNIGDVLSLSPVLMEKYMTAAETIAAVAAGAGPLPRAAAQRYRNARSPRRAEARHRVLYEAGYDVRAALTGRRADGETTPLAAILTVDGREVKRFEVDPRADRPRAFDTRVHLTNGDHILRLVLPEDDYDRNHPARGERNVVVDYLEVRGPFAPATPALTEPQRRVFVCGHLPGQHEPGCDRRVVGDLARRAWRRPVTPAEVAGLLRFVSMARQEGEPFEEGIRLAVHAVLVSPQFLFRIERDPAGSGIHPLNDFEFATRLSYFLWSSFPDDELFRAAEKGGLRTPDTLRAQVRRMLADPKSSRLVENFAGQWLELRNLDSARPDPKRFPDFDDALRFAMRRETTLFFDAIVHEDRSILDFIDAPYSYLNARLAKHYGISGVTGDEFRKVALEGAERGGVLTQASVLTVSSYPTRTSPVLRGKYLLENILGAPPPPPPPDVPPLDESKAGNAGTLREQMEAHRANPVCAACHSKMDPLGFAFENYDATGKFRSHEGRFEIDASGTLPSGEKFRGAAEFKKILRGQAPEFARCLTGKLMTYALGRGLERFDRPAVEAVCRKMAQNGYRFSAMVEEIAASPPFQMRRPEGATR
jgi:hypothetical protein